MLNLNETFYREIYKAYVEEMIGSNCDYETYEEFVADKWLRENAARRYKV